MKIMRLLVTSSVAASAMALLGTSALAQAQGGAGPAAGAASAASAPGGMGMGMGPGMGPGRGRTTQWGTNFTPGWSMMTLAERNAHRDHMRAMTTYEECKTYMDQHHEQMATRAKEKGGKALAQPRRDACAGLKP